MQLTWVIEENISLLFPWSSLFSWAYLYFLAGCCRELDAVFTSIMKLIMWTGLTRAAGGREKEEQTKRVFPGD